MKATIEIPDTLYRQVKARSALEGRAIREVTIELYEHWLAEKTAVAARSGSAETATAWLATWDKLGEEISRKAVDPRTSREILLAERR